MHTHHERNTCPVCQNVTTCRCIEHKVETNKVCGTCKLSEELKLLENEHALTSPELIGDDHEKIGCIQYWAEIVGMLRTLNLVAVSFPNKINIINAIKAEIELIETELHNDPSYPVQNADGSIDMEQLPPSSEDDIIDLMKSSTTDMTPQQQAQSLRLQKENIERLQRAAGINVGKKP